MMYRDLQIPIATFCGVMANNEKKKVDPGPAKRLKGLRLKAGFADAAEFAKKYDLPEVTYRSHENGTRGITVRRAKEYAQLLNRASSELEANANWILTGESVDSENAEIKAYDVGLSAGPGAMISSENFLYTLSFRRDWLRKISSAPTNKLAIVYVEGRSMEPTLYDGDPVLIDTTQTELKKEGIYALQYDGEALIKRLVFDAEKGVLRLISDNSAFPERKVKDLELVQIAGKAIWTGHRL